MKSNDIKKEWDAAVPIQQGNLQTEWDAASSLTGGQEPTGTKKVGDSSTMNERLSWKQVFFDAAQNTPESAYRYGKDLYQAIRHPIQTAAALGKVVGGYGEKLIPGTHPYEQYADAFTEHMMNRYGNMENFKQTLAKDPTGVLSDISMVLIPAGTLVKSVGKAGELGRVASMGSKLERLAASAEPLNIAKRIVSLPAKVIPQKALTKMYQSAVKLSTTIPESTRLKLAGIALDREIMPTVDGLYKLKDQINELNREIAKRIDSTTNRIGESIEVSDLFMHLDDLKKQHSFVSDWKDIDKVKESLFEAFNEQGITKISPKQAQKLKTEIYRKLETHYSKTTKSPATVEAKMAVARAAKELIEGFIPEIKQLNRTDGDLIQLYKALDRPVSRIQNRNLVSMDAAIKTGLGASIGTVAAGGHGGGIGAAAGLALSILEHPQSKTAISIFLNRLKKRGIKVSPSASLARLLATRTVEAEGFVPQKPPNFTPF